MLKYVCNIKKVVTQFTLFDDLTIIQLVIVILYT